eukprot:Nitzschia sp. Nitz4//scaffold19_size178191//150805//153585//NITZ4_002008-RA/size178191-processed-gene-0.32-mRNA-1//1//CDS//3329540774//2276//frame0
MNDFDSDSDSDLDFANLDMTGVNFDAPGDSYVETELEKFALQLELETVTSQWIGGKEKSGQTASPEGSEKLSNLFSLISEGKYIDALQSDRALSVFGGESEKVTETTSTWSIVQSNLLKSIQSIHDAVEVELVGVAAFNLFLQLNYTGPTMDIEEKASNINPHNCFRELLEADGSKEEATEFLHLKTAKRHTRYHNAVLAELACEGQLPFAVVEAPYMLLLARCIFSFLAHPTRGSWAEDKDALEDSSDEFEAIVSKLASVHIWNSRAIVAHERLLLTQEPTVVLWNEVDGSFPHCVNAIKEQHQYLQSMVFLEFGLACHHFERYKQAKKLFLQAKDVSGLFLEFTGAEGVRTKFQRKATAQLVVRAYSAKDDVVNAEEKEQLEDETKDKIKSQMIGFNEDSILHERVQFQESEENDVKPLTVLDQAILLGMCLDIKDTNPSDQLSAEEMTAYLSRVLCHHDDWIVYSTALLERAWIEFEGVHTKERAILQMQALADQHTDRLTFTQSTRASVEDSSPVQDRLKNLHSIVYPPRWQMLGDVAERYASIGIVTSAAEIFTEIESWDEVVDCYRRAGREKRAEEIVRERLQVSETPRMWTALGDISGEPEHFEKAITLSRGRFSQAYISLGKYYFDKGELQLSADNYRGALKLRPLLPSVWFRVGTISMQLGDWNGALVAFTEVVQQQPDEAEAWANVAAVHMHNKRPGEAYPALTESLKHNRSNWRVWVSKLYVSLDLGKFDEAAQACHRILDLSTEKSSQGIPELEEKCVKAVVGGVLDRYLKARDGNDTVGLDSARRSVVRVSELLDRIRSISSEPWVFSTTAYLHEQVGHDTEVYENLMKEYRALTAVRAWEKADAQVARVARTVTQIVQYQRSTKDELAKSKFLVSGVVKRIQQGRTHGGKVPEEVLALEKLLEEITEQLKEL